MKASIFNQSKSRGSPSGATQKFERLYYLDWLRVLAILTVFIYHSTRFFDLEDWHVKNLARYLEAQVWVGFLSNWMMPLIFVISGASLYYALDKGMGSRFFKDKVLRLLVPWIVGVFTASTLQVYLERRTHGQFFGSYFEFLPQYFNGFYTDVASPGNFAWGGMHLWYLWILFLFIVLSYPLLRWLKGRGRGLLDKLGDLLSYPGAAYLLALPVLVLEALTSRSPLDELQPGGWALPLYLPFFLGGFVIISSPRLLKRIRQWCWFYLATGALLLAGFALLEFGLGPTGLLAIWDDINQIIATLSAWSWILAFFGLGMRWLNFTSPTLKYSNEAVLPFYILHQTVLLAVGYFVVQWQIPDLAKWEAIILISFALIMALYEYLVRRSNLLRFLFGMKLLPASPATEALPALQTH
jgi:peptidoglycan/LPS O-acetylase OafA/YrhL